MTEQGELKAPPQQTAVARLAGDLVKWIVAAKAGDARDNQAA